MLSASAVGCQWLGYVVSVSAWMPMLLQNAWNAGVSPSDQEGAAAGSGCLGQLQDNLKPGWTVHVTHDNRLYYCK